MLDPAAQVRRCARCGQPTLVVARTWKHQLVGVTTGRETLELECRSCGAKVLLHPQLAIRVERAFAILLMPAIVPGLIFLASAREKARAWDDNPLVEGAPMPAPSSSGPAPRRCGCSAQATCRRIARQGTWTVRLGTRHDYECAVCHSQFSVHDTWGIVVAGLFAIALLALGTLGILFPPGQAVGAEGSNLKFGVATAVLGVAAFAAFGWRIRQRLAHPLS